MIPRHTLAAFAAAYPFLFACSAETTGPGAAGRADSSEIFAGFVSVTAVHDCDPALDNPGDFQSWIEIWQDADPDYELTDWKRIATSGKWTIAVHSGEDVGFRANPQIITDVARVDGQPVMVQAYVREMDDGQIDTAVDQPGAIQWRENVSCWLDYTECVTRTQTGEWRHTWSHSVNPRDDVFDLFNPGDEGCEFTVSYQAYIYDDF